MDLIKEKRTLTADKICQGIRGLGTTLNKSHQYFTAPRVLWRGASEEVVRLCHPLSEHLYISL
jgi:hypothetical protein